jgi:DNA-directed RNA polymerase specialized sigma subunit
VVDICRRHILSSEHIETRRKLKEVEKADFLEILDRVMLSENEEQIMKQYYMKHKTMPEIADNIGYSEIGVVKAHQRILKKISKII